jgi:hypothetical protein
MSLCNGVPLGWLARWFSARGEFKFAGSFHISPGCNNFS